MTTLFNSNSAKVILLLTISIVCTILVGSRLRWSESPGFMHQESYGIGYNHAVSIGDLCDPSPFAGLERQTSNVTDQPSFSFIYAIPNKLFRNATDIYTLHRVLGVLFYFGVLLAISLICSKLQFSIPISLFFLIHYGLSSQLLSYLFEAKLTLTSILWLCLMTLFFISMEKKTYENKPNIYVEVLLFPIACCLAYETYAVSRPLSVAILGFALLWIFVSPNLASAKWKLAISYIIGLSCGAILLKFLHPLMKFDQTLFEGRTESLVLPDGTFYGSWQETITKRLHELPHILEWPNYNFSSETMRETGWIDVFAMIGVTATVLVIFWRKFNSSKVGVWLTHQKWIIAFTIVLSSSALVIPLLSTTFIRGHRFFGLYFASTLLLCLLLEALMKEAKWLAKLLGGLALAATVTTAIHRTPLILQWSPGTIFTPEFGWDLINTLSKKELPPDYLANPKSVDILVCDQKNPPDWEHFWNSALYASNFGCQLSGRRTILDCSCTPSRQEDEKVKIVCLTRSIVDGTNKIDLRY